MKNYYPTKVIQDHNSTKKELAEKLGINQMSVHSYCTGNPTIANIERMAEALGAHIIEFFVPETLKDKDLKSFIDKQSKKRKEE